MSVSSVELWQRIATSQLASPLLCRTWAADAAAALSTSESMDGQRVAEQLVRQGKLTQFQVDTLLSGSDQPLVQNGFRLLEPVNFSTYPAPDVRSIWTGWWAVAKTPTSPTLWMRWIKATDLKEASLAKSHPSLPHVLKHSQVRHERLQSIYPPEMASGTLQLSTEPVQGTLLSGLCDGQPKSIDGVQSFLLDVSAGLAAMHAAGIAHGRITPDRICFTSDGRYLLVRDPLCSLTLQAANCDAERRNPFGLLAQKLPSKSVAAHYLAPEFLLPAQVPTPQSDCYSLGCVAWFLLTGQLPFTAKKPEDIMATQAEKMLDRHALAHVPEPLARVLWHCLAKNPVARFQNAQQLHDSLQAAIGLMAAGPSKEPIAPARVAKPTAVTPTAVTPTAVTPAKADAQAKPIAAAIIPASAVSETTAAVPTMPAAVAAKVVSDIKPSAEAKPRKAEPTTAPSTRASSPAPITSQDDSTQPPTESVATTAVNSAGVNSAPVNTPAVNTPAVTSAPRKSAPGTPPSRRSPVRKTGKQRKSTNKWLTPVIGGGALVSLILMVLIMSGGLGGSGNSQATKDRVVKPDGNNSGQSNFPGPQPEPVAVDPLAEQFELVSDQPNALWVPPRANEPIPLDLLPPGGQMFVALRPAALFSKPEHKQLLALLDADIGPTWQWITQETGLPPEQIQQVIVASYPGQSGSPKYALRVQLVNAQPLSQLKSAWKTTAETKVETQVLLTSDARAYYLSAQPLVDSQSITEFAVGELALMRDSATSQGVAGPLPKGLEQLWQATDRAAEINLLVSPIFLFTDGRNWIERCSPRLKTQLEKWLARDSRGLMLTSSLGKEWYYELRLVGTSDRDALVMQQKLNDAKQKSPQEIESWLVNELPHPHWRAMANRFPSMLRALDAQTRVGTENGQAIANGYLPMSAAPNLIYASWMSLQPAATSAATVATTAGPATPTATPLTPSQILDRKITLTIDQKGFESVMKEIAEQANEKLPAGTKPLRFEIDGTGFQRSGITRQKEIRDFKVINQTVREALIVLSKLGNPVQPLNDLESDDQKLLWVLIDGDNPDKALVSLTSRDAATAAGHKLPAEYSKE